MISKEFCKLVKGGVLSLALFASAGALAFPKYDLVVSFGDSQSDIGNISTLVVGAGGTLHPSGFTDFTSLLVPDRAYQVSGKFSDAGPIWVESLAGALGTPAALPSVLGGSGYAFGGARSTDGLPGVPDQPVGLSFNEQVAQFLSDNGGFASADSLYTITIGGNDVREAFQLAFGGAVPNPGLVAPIFAEAIPSIVSDIQALALAGARDVLLVNVPNLGKTPSVGLLGAAAQGAFTQLSLDYNAGLSLALDQLTLGLALAGIDLNLMILDSFGLLTEVVENPAQFGLTESAMPCVSVASVCSNPEDYVFWDGIHPTVAMYSIVTTEALRLLPVPVPALLLLAGLVALRRYRPSSDA